MMRRLKMLVAYIKGDLIVIDIEGNKTIVDAGNNSPQTVQNAATTFFKQAYKLVENTN